MAGARETITCTAHDLLESIRPIEAQLAVVRAAAESMRILGVSEITFRGKKARERAIEGAGLYAQLATGAVARASRAVPPNGIKAVAKTKRNRTKRGAKSTNQKPVPDRTD